MSQHLLTAAESRLFNGFLDHHAHDSVEWRGFHPALADKIPHKQGKEALARATKELLSFGAANAPLSSKAATAAAGGSSSGGAIASLSASASAKTGGTSRSGSGVSHWPSFTPDAHDPARSNHGRYDRHSPYSFSSYRPQQQQQHDQPTSSSSAFTLASLNVSARPSVPPSSASTSKRALPRDHQVGGSISSAGDGTVAKRARPTPPEDTSAPILPANTPSAAAAAPAKARRPSQSARRSAVPAAPSKPALLSPSQKRANHIQSEQKRRANIRRGYEALCDAVPALREAIRLDDEASAADASTNANASSASGGGREDKARKRKRRGEDEKTADGRAGPRSENVVLSKTIEYIRTLLNDRQDLVTRLTFARSVLAPEHPALTVSTAHADEEGIPLWEREWKGGSGAADEDEGEGGSEEDE
ncbi:hypothetical protein SCP_1301220 [Sparassis crispa]|uniref:BHLH domain-containing protein n=1 Tax=Sparassis crispa TaxID=139825 RepID=A0A401H1J5_9APHY|nr:hypothetical protein SCP_1301220 [Sparassis crispa]GBE88307.1 hypothetical protein SCP_1301220 [Sparassis crispa]